MSNLTNNTTKIQNLISKINNLPIAQPPGTDTSDATITANEVFAGEIAYGAAGKLTGTFTIDSELTEQSALIQSISELVATKAIPQGGTDTSNATATAADILSGKTAYAKGEKLTGTIPTKTASNLSATGATVTVPAGYYSSDVTKSVGTATAATPSITVSTTGLITAKTSQSAGYVSASSKSATKQLTTKGATTYTPTTSNQTIASSTYLTGTQTIKGDTNLKAENIASGVSIFGVTGTHSGAEDLSSELDTQESLISQLSTILDSKASGGSSGGSIETCTVTLVASSFVMMEGSEMIYYTDGSSNFKSVAFPDSGDSISITVVKNSLICASRMILTNSENAELIIMSSQTDSAYFISGDTTLTYE